MCLRVPTYRSITTCIQELLGARREESIYLLELENICEPPYECWIADLDAL